MGVWGFLFRVRVSGELVLWVIPDPRGCRHPTDFGESGFWGCGMEGVDGDGRGWSRGGPWGGVRVEILTWARSGCPCCPQILQPPKSVTCSSQNPSPAAPNPSSCRPKILQPLNPSPAAPNPSPKSYTCSLKSFTCSPQILHPNPSPAAPNPGRASAGTERCTRVTRVGSPHPSSPPSSRAAPKDPGPAVTLSPEPRPQRGDSGTAGLGSPHPWVPLPGSQPRAGSSAAFLRPEPAGFR